MCAKAVEYRLSFQTREDHPQRCVAFLVSSDEKLSALSIFKRLPDSGKRWFLTSFDWWCDRIEAGSTRKRYHGWDKSEFGGKYTECFVFKGKDGLRLYGFLCKPKDENQRFQLCALAFHTNKSRQETKESDLEKARQLSLNSEVNRAIKKHYIEVRR